MLNNIYVDDINNGVFVIIFGYIEIIFFEIKLWIIVIGIMYFNMYVISGV